MTARRYVTIWCDGDDCHQWIEHEHTAADARRQARGAGWVRRDGRDLCPACASERGVTSQKPGGQ